MTSEQKEHEVWDSSLYRPQFVLSWHKFVLFDLAQWINGLAFRNIHFSATGKPIIKIAEIKNGITSQTKFTNTEFDPSYHLSEGDMLFSWSGQPETSIDAFWWDGPDGWLNQHIFKVIPQDPCYRDYFYYLLKYLRPNFVQIARNKQTTGLGHITKKDLQNIYVSLPPIPEQKAIAYILGTLDEKFDLNRKINETLKAIARAIFKSWFVDFDPVRAKAEGRQPIGMDDEIAGLFPNSFVDSELGNIPKGWRVTKVNEMAFIDRGISYKGKYLSEDGLPMINLGCFLGEGRFRQNKIKGYSGEYKQKHTVVTGDLLMANTDITQNRIILGSPIIVPQIGSWKTYLFSHHVYALRMHRGTSHCLREFLYYSFMQDTFRERAEGFATGTTVLALPKEVILGFPIAVPEEALLNRTFTIFDPIHKRLIINIEENNAISRMRDALLPKLLSGEIRVRDAEKSVEKFT